MSSSASDPKRLELLASNMRQCYGLSGLPSNFAFSSDNKKLFFLVNGAIHYVDIDEDSTSSLQWKPLLPTVDQKKASTLSKEEALRRERMRASLGLNSFIYHSNTGRILVPDSPNWWICETDKIDKNGPNIIELFTSNPSSRIDCKLSPNANMVSFIRNNDLWIQDVDTLQETQITFSNLKNEALNTTNIGKYASGVAEYVMQEEFDRYTGYWWAPQAENGKVERILFVNTDETHLTTFNIPTTGIRGEVDKFVYPLAGEENARFSLSIATIERTKGSPSSNFIQSTLKHLNPSLKSRFPWVEYIPRLGWTPKGDKIWVQLLDRKQQRFALITIDINEFKSEYPEDDDQVWSKCNAAFKDVQNRTADSNSQTQASSSLSKESQDSSDNNNTNMSGITILHEENTNLWVNINDLIYFFKDGSERVLIGSELSNPRDSNKMRHLYLLTPSNGVYQRSQLTSGDSWQIDRNFLRVDEKREFVYFMATKDSPIESHLYVASTGGFNLDSGSSQSISFDNRKKIDPQTNCYRLTPAGCYHLVDMNDDRTMFVSCFSNVKEPHRVLIFSINLKFDDQCVVFPPSSSLASTLSQSIIQPKPLFDVNPPELFNFKNSLGETIYGCYFKPKLFDPSRKYPTILKVYGGPHVQYVSNNYQLTRLFLPLQLYASLGYLVVIIDGVGSWRRGLKFEGYLRRSMGTKEVQEQVEGLTHLIKNGIVDPERIAVTGWSYGGYLSLLCLAQRPDFFKLAISGAPVTQWEAYDTAYTERYMDTPQDNPEGYKMASMSQYVPNLPSEPNRLMLIHGNLDENVHICHTFEFIQQLIENNKPYQLQVFPQERHGVRDNVSATYLELTILRFLTDHL